MGRGWKIALWVSGILWAASFVAIVVTPYSPALHLAAWAVAILGATVYSVIYVTKVVELSKLHAGMFADTETVIQEYRTDVHRLAHGIRVHRVAD